MTQKEQTLRTARVVDYNRYYKPYFVYVADDSCYEFFKNDDYEYVQYSIKRPIEGCPNCFETIKYWKKGQWNDAWRGFRKDELKQKLMDDEIRMRKTLTTEYLRGLLEDEALEFKFGDMQVVVFPKDTDDKDAMTPENDVYVNNIHQRKITFDSNLNKKWFGRYEEDPKLHLDWRNLLNLTWPKPKDLDLLYEYFEGVYTGTREDFYPEPPVENNVQQLSLTVGRLPRKEKKKLSRIKDKNIKKLRQIQNGIAQAHYTGCKKRRAKRFNSLSEHVRLDKRAKQKRTATRAAIEIKKLLEKQKKRKNIELKNEINHKEMTKLALVCIESQLTKKIFRIPQHKADKYTTKWFEFVPKHKYKLQLRLEREEKKAISAKQFDKTTVKVPIIERKRKVTVTKDKNDKEITTYESKIKRKYINNPKFKYSEEGGELEPYQKDETILNPWLKEKVGDRIITVLKDKLFSGENRKKRREVLQTKKLGSMYAKQVTIKFKHDPEARYPDITKKDGKIIKGKPIEFLRETAKNFVTNFNGFSYKTMVIFNYPHRLQLKMAETKKQIAMYREEMKKVKEEAALKKAKVNNKGDE